MLSGWGGGGKNCSHNGNNNCDLILKVFQEREKHGQAAEMVPNEPHTKAVTTQPKRQTPRESRRKREIQGTKVEETRVP